MSSQVKGDGVAASRELHCLIVEALVSVGWIVTLQLAQFKTCPAK
jgi:hypothetical protein